MRVSSRLVLALALGLSVPALIVGACGDPAEIPSDATTSVSSGLAGAPPTDAGDGGRGGGVGQGGEGGGGAGGAPPTVHVGLVANPLVSGGGAPGPADRLVSAATAFAAGARVAAIERRWGDLDAAALEEDLALARAGCAPEGPCRPIAFTLALVDGEVDGRPEDLQGQAWDEAATRLELEADIAGIVSTLGSDLAVLTLGARTDRWLDENEDDASGLASLLQAGVERATALGGEDLLVGVGLTHDGALSPDGSGPALRSLGSALTLTLLPGAAAPAEPLPSPSSVAQLLDAIAALSPGKPVALVETGYPSSADLGASAEGQAAFLDALFAAVDARRASFPVVIVSRMHDLDEAACAAEGLELQPEDPEATAYRCSTGLRADDGAPKASWNSFLAGAARLASSGTDPNP